MRSGYQLLVNLVLCLVITLLIGLGTGCGQEDDFFAQTERVPEEGEVLPNGENGLWGLCHIPADHTAHELIVGADALQAHLDHGDYLGACE